MCAVIQSGSRKELNDEMPELLCNSLQRDLNRLRAEADVLRSPVRPPPQFFTFFVVSLFPPARVPPHVIVPDWFLSEGVLPSYRSCPDADHPCVCKRRINHHEVCKVCLTVRNRRAAFRSAPHLSCRRLDGWWLFLCSTVQQSFAGSGIGFVWLEL